MSYKVGQWITVADTDCRVDITANKPYEIVRVMGTTSIEIVDDAHDTHAIRVEDITLVPAVTAARSTTAPPVFKAQYGSSITGAKADVLIIDDDVDDYEQVKASASVTSKGLYKAGDELVYCDGTITKQPMIVVRCTATCVWFEGCYSMPFNPTEFYNVNET